MGLEEDVPYGDQAGFDPHLPLRTKNPEDSDPFALRVLIGEGKSSENFLNS